MKITRILLAMTIMVALVFTSCKQKDGEKKSVDSENIASNELSETLLGINPGLRDPSVLMVALDMAGAEYIEGLVVPMENVEFYAKDEARAALALGVYTVDIAYLVSYGKNEQAITKYERARKLSKVIGLQSSFEQGIFERYLTAGANPDSLQKSLTLTAENIDAELTEAERARHAVLFVTGEFIEKMYLVTQIILQYPDDFPADVRSQLLRNLMVAVTEQEQPLDDLIKLLDQIREEDEGARFMAEMNNLRQIYTEANFKEMIANWTPQTDVGGDYLVRIAKQVESLRTGLVSSEAL